MVKGRHFLQIPGPTNVPEQVLLAMARPTMDHRSPEFAELSKKALSRLGQIFKTEQPVIMFPCSGTGAGEAAFVNTLSPGDKVVMFETGFFAMGWAEVARRLGLEVDLIPGDWRSAADSADLAAKLAADPNHEIKAVCVVHSETSTSAVSSIKALRNELDKAGHPALLMADTISSLVTIDYRHDEWGVDVTVGGSQKGLMLPPGMGFNAVSQKALKAGETAGLKSRYWDWQSMIKINPTGFYPYTPNTNLIYGLNESLDMILDQGLDSIFARHARHAKATRIAVETWGLERVCRDESQCANGLTAVFVPEGLNADEFRKTILEKFNMSLGNGLGQLAGKVFRIGHMGYFNDLMLAGTLSGVEMSLALAKAPHNKGGVQAALEYLADTAA